MKTERRPHRQRSWFILRAEGPIIFTIISFSAGILTVYFLLHAVI